ncbi:hypothetical protein HPB48_022597 [Haemaphysalis longicornis]|uniref:Uncharacterized protein n=1 Tax=Haemaphysalis longicornis TaxID=44386 RepID=A0A9J6H567_HAELO|nr:hypothetical protein HPB48_022597 [Haemaphysalis longicornis]
MSLQYAFYVAHNTISKIVSEVCRALYTVLSQDFLKDRSAGVLGGKQASQCGAILELPKKGSNCSREARNVRDTFRHYFYREGQVSWQWRLITK